jgi:hypothetical protein
MCIFKLFDSFTPQHRYTKVSNFCYAVWLWLNSLMMDACGPKHVGIFGVKLSYYRPGQALRFPVGWGSQISRQSAYEGGNISNPTHRADFTPPPKEIFLVIISCRDRVNSRAIVRQGELCQWKAWKTAEVFFEYFANIFPTYLLKGLWYFQLLSSLWS